MNHPTVKELQLAGRLLECAANEFANHGCNDMSKETWGDMTKTERKALIKEFHMENGEPDEADEGHSEIEDWVLMGFLAEKLKAFSAPTE